MSMTLHDAMARVLADCPDNTATFDDLSLEIWKRALYVHKTGHHAPAAQLKLRAKHHPDLFTILPGGRLHLIAMPALVKTHLIRSESHSLFAASPAEQPAAATVSDRSYVIDLCDEVLGKRASREHTFDFLRGDAPDGKKGKYLPIDAFYPELGLAVEYHERQQITPLQPADSIGKSATLTQPGGQRALYQTRRHDLLAEHKITLVELSYRDFSYAPSKRLLRNRNSDLEVISYQLGRRVK